MLPRTPEPEVMDTVDDAVDYDQMDHSHVNQLFVDDFLEALREWAGGDLNSLSASLQIVDLGTGTAQIPVRLLQSWPQCRPISACDLSVEMLRLAKRNICNSGFDGHIHPVFCDAKRLPFGDHSVDVIVSNSIVHHIPEPAAIFAEVARCLVKGGLLFFRDLLRPATQNHVEELVMLYAANEAPHAQTMFRESLHAALTIDEVKQLLADAGLHGAKVHQTSDRHWTAIVGKANA
ncbi:MAG: class I SAM-dependent methyltransferase [Planctomycetaceae bacterium]|nr:class I SAM-dependent methyltransferase [Planctomycetaceae bacterium]